MFARVLAAAAKPLLAGGVIIGAAGSGYAAYDRWTNDPATPFERIQSLGTQLLVSEFGSDADTIVSVDAHDVTARVEVARIAHAPEWGVFATLSPDGRAIAYTALPEDTAEPSPASPATAGIVETNGDVTALADDVDLLVPPVWSPDSGSIVVRKNTPADDGRGTFELLLLGRDGSRATITTWSSAAVFPIAFAPDAAPHGGALYYAALNERGTDLYRVGRDGSGETLVAHLSDDVARDWRLSPDGTQLAFTVVMTGAEPSAWTKTLDLATGGIADASIGGATAELSPVWAPDGGVTMTGIGARGGVAVSRGEDGSLRALTDGEGVIDVPLAWSPDGTALALRSIDGTSALDAGSGQLEVVTPDGVRQKATPATDALVVGWLE